MEDKNPFGGGNKRSLYTPMSETEQEVLSRLVEAGDFQVRIDGWGHVDRPRVTFGDLRVSIAFGVTFDRPEFPIPVHFFDLELWAQGIKLFAQRQSAVYNDLPLQIATGVHLEMIWDIAIQAMDSTIVKQIKPGAKGLTSRWLDRDTGQATLTGNTNLTPELKKLLFQVRTNEQAARADTLKRIKK